jgi:tetratricopeptide (TPR) repeat protein
MPDPDSLSPDELRQRLFEAAGDADRLEELCARHRNAILAHFHSWRKLPQGVREVPPLAERYVAGMVAVARVFAERMGRPELMNLLTGPPESNPLLRWQHDLAEAQRRMEGLQYAEATALLTECLERGRGMQGSGVAAYLPVTLGMLGQCQFQMGEADRAVAPTEKALELCLEAGDGEGERAYLSNLYEIHRYRGDAEAASRCAGSLADALQRQGDVAEAMRYRKQAALVRAGEPLNRVVCEVDGRRMELDEGVAARPKHARFLFERDRLALRPAEEWTRRGQEAGAAGRHEEALEHFRRAAAADRFDPHSRYQSGLALLHLRRYADAVAAYEQTEALAPGWFHCRSDLWLARQLASGRFNHPVLLLYHVLEDGSRPPQEKLRLAEEALGRAPDLAFLHEARGKTLVALGRRDEAAAAFRRGLECVEEPDLRTRLLMDLAAVLPPGGERSQLLREAVALKGNLVAAAMAALTPAET